VRHNRERATGPEYKDPLSPPPPGDPVFNPDLNVWALSRYADVMAALREPALWPVAPRKAKNLKIPDETALQALRARVLDAFSSSRLNEWKKQIERVAEVLPIGYPFDLVTGFAEPLCLASAEIVTGSNPADRESLLAAARIVSRAAAEPYDEALRLCATQADAELEHYFRDAAIPIAGPTFVALSRTVACLLASGWLALFRHPAELAKIGASPDGIPKAIEEILRYACVPQSVFRHASRPLGLCGLQLAEGDRLVLQIASANRDPLQFSDPDRFNSARREASHLSLGFGLHSCVGGALIRMTAATATRAFAERLGSCEICGPVEWQGGAGFRSPATLRVQQPAGTSPNFPVPRAGFARS
jgi:cytochrome P450